MNRTEAYEHGQFCWADLATADPAAAKDFYGDVFGWTFVDFKMGAGDLYTICRRDGADVAGLFRPHLGQSLCGWSTYIAVENCHASTEEARAQGGVVLASPFELPDLGRMAVVADPDGAAFCVWQRNSRHRGYARLGPRPGTVCWSELASARPDVARSFYGRLFGWGAWETVSAEHSYIEWLKGDQPVGGMLPLSAIAADVPPHWLTYFAVADCDRAVASVHAKGGMVMRDAFPVPDVGRVAVVRDPIGAVFAVIALSATG